MDTADARLCAEWQRAYEAGELPMITVYDHPADFPYGFVARLFLIRRGAAEPIATDFTWASTSLDRLRAVMPPGLHRIPREPGDSPSIIETWT